MDKLMRIMKRIIVLVLAGCFLLSGISPALAAPEATVPAATEKSFPGLNEVIPEANAAANRISVAGARVQEAESLDNVYARLDALAENLRQLEERYDNWEQINDWPLTRLLGAQGSYTDLRQQQEKLLETIYSQLASLEQLRTTWEKEKVYWQEWHASFEKNGIKVPEDVFTDTRRAIEDLLERIDEATGILVRAQQKYAPGTITSRLRQIENTLDNIRQNAFRRNTFSLLEAEYYRQFDGDLFPGFLRDLATSVTLPDTFFKRYAGINTLNAIGVLSILLLLLYRKRRQKTPQEEWRFLYQRPLSGAVFITLGAMLLVGDFYQNAPPIWRLLVASIITIAAIRLLNATYQQQFARNFVRIIAILFIVNVGLQVFGVPVPIMQLIQALLCAAAAPLCLLQIRNHRQNMYRKHLIALYMICGVSLLAFVTAVLGFATLTTNLIGATLSTFILFVLVQMALRLISGGIKSFMALEWVKSRQFMETLGVKEATRRLTALLRIIVLVNTGVYLLVVWKLFDNPQEVRSYLLNLEFTYGEFRLSVEMVLMIVVVLYLTTLLSWLIQAFLDSQVMTPKKMDRGVKESLKRLTHYGLFCVGLIAAVSMAGLELQKVTILAGALGVGIGFGLQNIVNNFVSGLILLFERPVKVGDVLNIDQDWGTITKIGLRSTVFETFDRSEIIVPNADLISQKVTNWTFSSKMVRAQLPVGVAYGSPLEKVLKILDRAALEHKEVLSYPAPDTIFVGFGSSSIDFILRFWVYTIDDRMRIRTDVAVIIDRLFREEGITIPFPQQDLHLRSVEPALQSLFVKKPAEAEGADEGTPV
jgi:small-conductance mechanosensitive channel